MFSKNKSDRVDCLKYVTESNFELLDTPNFVVKLSDGNNIIQYVDSFMVIDTMTRFDDDNTNGVVFTGTVYPKHLKRSLYSFDEPNTSSIYVNEFIIDMSSPEQLPQYSFFCSDSQILTKVKKIMKIPTAFEPLDCCFIEILHTRGKQIL